MKKLLYLFLALLLPGLIFVFLKYAGKNEFSVPIFYENGVDSLVSNCGAKYEKPYHLNDSVWKLTGQRRSSANLMLFPNDELNIGKFRTAIADEFGQDVWIGEMTGLFPDSQTFDRWKDCNFFLKESKYVVLFDGEGRIRGYYSPASLDELDRLRVELKILLKKY